MQLDRASLAALLRESVLDPRGAARRLLTLDGGSALALPAAGIMAILSAVISVLLNASAPPTGNPTMDQLAAQPLLLALFQFGGLLLLAAIVTGVGRMFGGKGRFAPTLLILAWFDFLILVLQVILLLIILALPGLGGALILFALALAFWFLASFVAEVHGFGRTLPTLCR
jgi:hypothetical protein